MSVKSHNVFTSDTFVSWATIMGNRPPSPPPPAGDVNAYGNLTENLRKPYGILRKQELDICPGDATRKPFLHLKNQKRQMKNFEN